MRLSPDQETPHRWERNSASTGGCDFPVDPALHPPDVAVFWSPLLDTGSVILQQAPPLFGEEADQPAIASPKAQVDELGLNYRLPIGADDALNVLKVDGQTDSKLVAIVPLSIDGFGRLAALHRLLALLHSRAIPPDTRMSGQQRTRAAKMLRASDARAQGASQQDIARNLLRIARQDRHSWQDSSARFAVMALLRDARAMISGGYRKLLRHRIRP